MREQGITKQNTERISPSSIQSWLAASAFRLIHDVIVHEGGEMNEFDDNGEIDMCIGDSATRAAREQRHQRPQSFAIAVQCIGDVAVDRGIEGGRLFCDSRRNFIQLRLHRRSHAG